MSSSINLYAVPVERLIQVLGSRDRKLIEAITAEHDAFLTSINDIDDDAELKCEDAVAELINGEISEDAPGYMYGYAIEAICSHLGDELPNICPISRASAWIEQIDHILERKAIPVRLSQLVFGGCPVQIPEPDDCPCIGHWQPMELAAAATAFQAADLTDIEQESAETLEQIRAWVHAAAKMPGVSIVGFLS